MLDLEIDGVESRCYERRFDILFSVGESGTAAALLPLVSVKGRKGDEAARRQDGGRSSKDLVRHAEMGDHQVDRTKLAVVDPLRIAAHERDAVKAEGAGTLIGLLDDLIRPVDSDDPPGLLCQGKGQAPIAAPDIQNGPLTQRLFPDQAQERIAENAVFRLTPFAGPIGPLDPLSLPL